jgi:hypothetical protein
VTLAASLDMTPLSKCLAQLWVLVFVEWLLLTPAGNDVTRPQKEWHKEQSFDTPATMRELPGKASRRVDKENGNST